MAFADLVEASDRLTHEHLGGVDVVYQPGSGDPVTVRGIFDANFVLVEGGEAGVEQITPAVFLRLEDLPSDPSADDPTIAIAGRSYSVRHRQVDGSQGGGIRLYLRRSDL